MAKAKYNTDIIVTVKGLKCKIIAIDIFGEEEEIDYLCEPLDKTKMVHGQWELGAGWVIESNIRPIYEPLALV